MTDRGLAQLGRGAAIITVAVGALAACSDEPETVASASSAAPTGIRFLADAGDDATGFSQALEPRAFEFPADHLPHPGFRTEWWYFTGNVFDDDDNHYGFELTLFRIALSSQPGESASSFASSQVWMAHFALTDTRRQLFTATERLSRGLPEVTGASASGTGANARVLLTIEDWSISYTADSVRLVAVDASTGIELELSGLERIVLQGDRGLDAKGPEPGNASYYFSAPRLAVTGDILAGADRTAVSGTAWMDREWSTSALSPDMAGWDWFALQLDDGRDLMFYRLRGADGSTSEFSGGTLVQADGQTTRLEVTAIDLRPTRHWESPATGSRYPVTWQLQLPEQDMQLEVRPRIDAQELDLTVRYWEGAVIVSGKASGEPITGVGYLELAGY